MHHKAPTLLLVLLHCAATSNAAAGTATRSAASAANSSRSRQEAGQFFIIDLNFGGSDEASNSDTAPSSTAFSFPGVLGSIPGAIASVLGQPAEPQQPEQPQQQQQQQLPSQPSPQKKQPQHRNTAPPKPHAQTQPAKQPKQPKQDGKRKEPNSPATQSPTKQQHAQQNHKPPASMQHQQQQQQTPPSLIARNPPNQQQQQHRIYYKRQQRPKSKQPMVASAPSYAPQVPAGSVPMCEWRADFNQCQVHRHYYMAVQETPTSYIAQTITAASARDYSCAAQTEAATCQESSQGPRCGWNLSGGRALDSSGCRSFFMAEWTVFSYLINAGVGAAQAALGLSNLGAFSCPGSLAARALACNTAYPMDHQGNYDPNLCATAAPGCIFQQSSNSCVMSPELSAQLALLRPDDVGHCSAACYLRVLDSCPAKPYATSSNAVSLSAQPDRCWANKGCTWSNGVCGPDLYSSQLDSWGRKLAAAAEVCAREKEVWGCRQAGAGGVLPLPSSAIQEALQRNLPGAGKDDAACPV